MFITILFFCDIYVFLIKELSKAVGFNFEEYILCGSVFSILPNFTFIFNIFSIVVFKKITSKIITIYLLWFCHLALF